MRLKPFVKSAIIWKDMSTCVRLAVGAVIFDKKSKMLLSTGYNGTSAGVTHCTELFRWINSNPCIRNTLHGFIEVDSSRFLADADEDGWIPLKSSNYWYELHHCFSEQWEVHAEQNALLNLIKTNTGISDDLAIVTTTAPCLTCAKLIVAAGIRTVYYISEYDRSNTDTAGYFLKNGVQYIRVMENTDEVF